MRRSAWPARPSFPPSPCRARRATGARNCRDLLSAPSLFWSLGPALAVALFDGGARSAAVESARAAHDQAVATYRQTVLTALQEVEDNLAAAAALEREQQLTDRRPWPPRSARWTW